MLLTVNSTDIHPKSFSSSKHIMITSETTNNHLLVSIIIYLITWLYIFAKKSNKTEEMMNKLMTNPKTKSNGYKFIIIYICSSTNINSNKTIHSIHSIHNIYNNNNDNNKKNHTNVNSYQVSNVYHFPLMVERLFYPHHAILNYMKSIHAFYPLHGTRCGKCAMILQFLSAHFKGHLSSFNGCSQISHLLLTNNWLLNCNCSISSLSSSFKVINGNDCVLSCSV
eukprot:211314_1